jgi:D-arabinose 1-dehydrogenase-like Zn-dependent alcohol dehydrogenase
VPALVEDPPAQRRVGLLERDQQLSDGRAVELVLGTVGGEPPQRLAEADDRHAAIICAMRAVIYDAFGAPPRVEQVPDPAPAVHGAVIRVEASGLCRSDWHGWMGHDPDITTFPHVPGHELAGVIEIVGADVGRHRPGERVTVPFVCACGTCTQCANGDHQVCDAQTQPGFTHWGSFAEYVAIDHADVNLVPLPQEVAFEAAAALGCRFATAYRALHQVGRLQAGERVAVHGCGGVGLSAVMIAVAAGAEVVAHDVDATALERARELGAHTEDGEPVDLSVDAIGHPDALAASIRGLRKRGRHVQIGLLPDPPRVPMDLVIGRELELLGSHGMAAHAYPAMLEQVRSGRLRPGDLVRRRLTLEQAAAALPAMGDAPADGISVVVPTRGR